MRIDIPQEVPRRRTPESPRFAPPLEAGPLEQRRERLTSLREERRMPNIPRPEQKPGVSQPREQRDRTHRPPHDRPIERRTRRNEIPQRIVGLPLREEERKALAEIGRFRVVATRDLAESVYDGNRSQLQRDLRFLEQKGMVEVNAVNARRDGRGGKIERIEVVTLTRGGRDVVRRTGGLPEDQRIYARMVKPREVEHDAQIYRAYRKEAQRITENGGSNLRVKLDFELKSDVQKAIYRERKADPQRDMNEIKQQVAKDLDLPFVNDGIQIPDARIVYDLDQKADDSDQGSRTGHEDIEVLTAAYSPAHLRAKAQSGFNLYASSSDRSSITARIEGDHHLIDSILEL
jgi:hypothetical protein